jgi:uncharacterized protein DUF4236
MALRFRKSFRFGPIRWHFTEHGLSSWSFKLWRWTWNSRTKRHTVDLPGPASWTSK